MCGIVGIARFDKTHSVRPSEITRMNSAIIHRGPDDGGVFISKNGRVGLGNRRLAIIDLSPKGHQPMSFLNRYTIVSNNEIYNFKEERDKLIKKGYRFKSNCDTEVILALYAHYGIKCLNHMRGMFAIAIYDSKENTLFIARDRIGKKPLKYSLTSDGIVFASELKAILRTKGVNKKIDYNAIHDYLTYGYTPSPLTGFEGIKKLPPGSYILLNLNRKTFEIKKYWQPDFSEKQELSEREWVKKILDTLEESTRLRMISDVPVGAFLSGGVDSSMVVATMASLSTKPIKTFTVAFKDKKYDESAHAARIAKMYKTDHHVLTAKPQSVEILPFLAKQYEEPFADASNVLTYLISDLTKKYVTVSLNGDGGDENFAGYPNRYNRLKRDTDHDNYLKFLGYYLSPLIKSANQITKTKLMGRLANFSEKTKLPLYERFASYNTVFFNSEIENFAKDKLKSAVKENNPLAFVADVFDNFKGKDIKDAGLMFDLKYFLPDQLLAKVDIASMAVSLEARSPFLDQNMIELAGQIPFNLKVKKGETKYILKKAAEKIIPLKNIYRPKIGFTIPLNKWFKGKLNSYALEVLNSKNALYKEFIDQDFAVNLVKNHGKDGDLAPKIWALISLELWLKAYFD